MRISDLSSDVCSSDLHQLDQRVREPRGVREAIFVPVVDRSILAAFGVCICAPIPLPMLGAGLDAARRAPEIERAVEYRSTGVARAQQGFVDRQGQQGATRFVHSLCCNAIVLASPRLRTVMRWEEHTSELQSLMRMP